MDTATHHSEVPQAIAALGASVFFVAVGALAGYWLMYIVAGVLALCAVSMLGTTTVGPHYISRRSPFSDRKIFWCEITHIELGAGCTWFVLYGTDKRLAFAAPKALGEADAGWPSERLEEMAIERGIPIEATATAWLKLSRGT